MDSLNPAAPPALTFAQRGFTLTEIAVVMAIVALLIGGMILPMAAQQDLRYNTETQKTLDNVVEALYGYAASRTTTRPYLPCPDTDSDGLENRPSTACSSQEGTLPWATLGLGRQDAWGNPIYYRVSAAFSDSSAGFTLTSLGDIKICTSSACTTELTSTAPVVILSRGKNGLATPTHADELENNDTDANFVYRTHDNSSAGYDDVAVWLSQLVLLNRMVSAGKLP